MTSVADRKGIILQYHENRRVITGANTVTMHLATHGEPHASAHVHTRSYIPYIHTQVNVLKRTSTQKHMHV